MPTKPRIVFVDDEANILSGMRRSLRGMRERWDMAFFPSGGDALINLSERPADVVVSDMRMPEMDGVQLLSEVKKRWPQTVRFILSGFSSEEAILSTIGPSHQYLAKPCAGETLVDAVERSLNVRKLLGDENLLHVCEKIDNLPMLSNDLITIVNMMNSDRVSTRDIAELVSRDVMLSATLLKLTNSAYFGLPSTITDPQQVVALLGLETVKSVILLAIMNAQITMPERTLIDVHRINDRSIEISQIALKIAKSEGLSKATCDEIACIGILMHIGTLVLVSQFPDQFGHVIKTTEEQKIDISSAERSVFGTDHGAVGAYILGLWGFNDTIVDCVFHHHRPSLSATNKSILVCIHAAQYLGKCIEAEDPETCEDLLDQNFVEQMNLRPKLDEWANLCKSVIHT